MTELIAESNTRETTSTSAFLSFQLWFFLIGLFAVVMGLFIGFGNERAFVFVFMLIVGVALVLVSLRFERFPIYLLVGSLSIAEVLRVDAIPTTLLIIPGGLSVMSFLFAVVFHKRRVFIQSPILITSLLLGFWAVIATFNVGSVSESRPYWLVIILLLLIPNLLIKAEHLLRASWLFFLPLGALGAYVTFDRLAFYLAAQHISMDALHLVPLDIGDKNVVGLWLTLGIPFVYYFWSLYSREPAKRFWLLCAGVSMLAGIVATLSIGALIGLGVIVVLIVNQQPQISARIRNTFLGAVLLAIIISGPISERLAERDLTSLDTSWGTYRGELWLAGYRTILDYPVFGLGLAPARRSIMLNYIEQWFIQDWYRQGILLAPHNIFLSVGVDIGLPGMILYMIILGTVLISLVRLNRRFENQTDSFLRILPKILLIALIGGWVQGMGLSEHLNKFLWFLMGCVAVLARISQNNHFGPRTGLAAPDAATPRCKEDQEQIPPGSDEIVS